MKKPVAAWIGLFGIVWIGTAPVAAEESLSTQVGVPEGVEAEVAPGDATPLPATADDLAREVAAALAPELPAIHDLTSFEQIWHTSEQPIDLRVLELRRSAVELGAWNFDPAARAIDAGGMGGDPLERARAAVTLAPDLPSARMELARALWLHGDSPISAIRSVIEGLRAIARHLEASLWFAGSVLYILSVALVVGSLVAILGAGLFVVSHVAHDLGHLISSNTPTFARYALLGALLFCPLALGEGFLGVALVVLAMAIIYGSRAHRIALGLAAGALLVGAYPMIRGAGSLLDAFPSDPIASAAYATASGLASPVEIARLRAASRRDPLAARGLAIQARRTGNLGMADALYQGLLENEPHDLELMNNAANVRLELGHMDSALALYRKATELGGSPVVLFNLSQAYGRAFQMDEHNRTLAEAQSADSEFVARLTTLQAGEVRGFVVDLPLSNRLMWDRILESERGEGIAAEFRSRWAPGRLGHDAKQLAAVIMLIVLTSSLVGSRLETSRNCTRCGTRMCPHCEPDCDDGQVCISCTNLFLHPEKTDRSLRLGRISALRDREARINQVAKFASMLIPGAAGLLSGRPLASLLGCFFFALAVAAFVWRDGVVPDPLVAGALAQFAFIGLAALSLVFYGTIAATSIVARKENGA